MKSINAFSSAVKSVLLQNDRCDNALNKFVLILFGNTFNYNSDDWLYFSGATKDDGSIFKVSGFQSDGFGMQDY